MNCVPNCQTMWQCCKHHMKCCISRFGKSMYVELYLKNEVTGKADMAFHSGRQQLTFLPGVTKWERMHMNEEYIYPIVM